MQATGPPISVINTNHPAHCSATIMASQPVPLVKFMYANVRITVANLVSVAREIEVDRF